MTTDAWGHPYGWKIGEVRCKFQEPREVRGKTHADGPNAMSPCNELKIMINGATFCPVHDEQSLQIVALKP